MSYTGTAMECVRWLSNQPDGALFKVARHRPRRSLTANAYYWALLNRLAATLRMPDSEVHGRMLRDYGVCDVFTVREDVPLEGYFRYFDVIGTGALNGRAYKHVKVYKGSSAMNSAEFSRLLEGLRGECEAQGVQAMTPAEIAALPFVEGET